MAKLKLRQKELIKLGYPAGKVIGIAMNTMHKYYKRKNKEEVLTILANILNHPEEYEQNERFSSIVAELKKTPKALQKEIPLQTTSIKYPIYGAEGIEKGALEQMNIAMRLPITVEGALMADAHQGYGLPIGGVLATENAIIPYGVGVDIGCRMCLTLYDLKPDFLRKNQSDLKEKLLENTRFGFDKFDRPMDDEVLHREEFKTIPMLKRLKNKARQQIGSSGSGNHFVEFGVVRILDSKNEFNLLTRDYLGVLSHSGSRGLGANIANHYTQLAMDKTLLPKAAKHLAWLDLDSEEGMEYWLAMNLAGDYASACHHHIHRRLAKALGEKPLARIENHHNFAWKEKLASGKEAIVHRKGATPAGKGVLGVIPGSMTAPGFIVRGTGKQQSLNSASHGAGRLLSRRKAKESTTFSALKKMLKNEGVELIGGGLDESPIAYKDIHQVMQAQQDLVEIVGTFFPKIVRMAK